MITVGAVPLLHLVLKKDPNHPLLGERILILAVVPPVVILDHVSIPRGRGVHNTGVKGNGDPVLGIVVVQSIKSITATCLLIRILPGIIGHVIEALIHQEV